MIGLVICKDGVKRELSTPFSIYLSADALDALILELQYRRGYVVESSFVWLNIDPGEPHDPPPGLPRKWTE